MSLRHFRHVKRRANTHSNDKQEIEPALAKLGQLPDCLGTVENLLADTGYFSQGNVNACADATIKPYIAQKRQSHNQPLEARFQHEPEIDETTLPQVEAMTHRLTTKAGKALYGKRKSTVETVFVLIKHVLGFRQLQLRGLESVQSEWNLVCIGWNLKRMHVLRG